MLCASQLVAFCHRLLTPVPASGQLRNRQLVNTGGRHDLSSYMCFNIPGSLHALVRHTARAGFLHVATSATIVDHSTYLDGATNQYQLLIVTPLLSPADESSYTRRWFTGVSNDHPIGVWFDATVSKWAIYKPVLLHQQPGRILGRQLFRCCQPDQVPAHRNTRLLPGSLDLWQLNLYQPSWRERPT